MNNNIIGGVNHEMQHQGRRPGGDNNQPPPPHHRCPRCDSHNTKFCYYNNYSFSQPRYYCKACRRYWTQGGTLRNVPVGGGCRKNKRGTIRAARTQDIMSPAVRRHPNATAMVPPPQMAPFYGGGSFMPQPLPAGGQSTVAAAGGPFNGTGHIGLNTPPPPHQLELQPPAARFFPPQLPSLMTSPPARFSPWGQSFFNTGGANDQAGPSYQWGDGHQGFNP